MASRPTAGRRVGYVIGAGVNVALLVLVNVWPGWRSVSFLTADAADVVGLVNLSLVLGIVTNGIYVVRDTPGVKALGDVVTTSVALAVLIRVQQVFPFDFDESGVDWAFWARAGLWFAIVVTCIALIVQLVTLVRVAVESATGSPDST